MSESEKEHPWWQKSLAAPIIVALVVGAGSSYVGSEVALARYDERLNEVENKLDKRPTDSELSASEARSRAYTDSQLADIMITLTELNAVSKNTAEDVKEIKSDLRRLEDKK